MNISIITLFVLLHTSIYSLHFTNSDGIDVSFSDFKHKKILMVNTATGSKYNGQFAKLEQLYEKYKDSLVIIVFPSNDFGKEPKSDREIKNFLVVNHHIKFIVASKISLTGSQIAPIYDWLANASLNGVMDNPVPGDFCKYLIDSNGNLVGAFSGIVDPLSDDIQNAIMTNYN